MIDNNEDIIDSRDVIERISVLEESISSDIEESDEHEVEELRMLKALASEGEASLDWYHGETLIRDAYFRTYAEELARDCGLVADNYSWPVDCLDWDKAANELKRDYIELDFAGVEYWMHG